MRGPDPSQGLESVSEAGVSTKTGWTRSAEPARLFFQAVPRGPSNRVRSAVPHTRPHFSMRCRVDQVCRARGGPDQPVLDSSPDGYHQVATRRGGAGPRRSSSPAHPAYGRAGRVTTTSSAACRLIQNSGVVPSAPANSQAVAGLTPRFPRTISLTRCSEHRCAPRSRPGSRRVVSGSLPGGSRRVRGCTVLGKHGGCQW